MRQRMTFALLLMLGFTLSHCRSRGRGTTEPLARDVEIELSEVSGTFNPSSSYTYELSGCGSAIYTGKLGVNGLVHFRVDKISSGDKCRLVVVDPSQAGDTSVSWISGTPGVIYWTKNLVIIERGSRGQLRGLARLSPGIQTITPNEPFHIRLLVDFQKQNPAELKQDTLTGSLTCEPPLGETGSFKAGDGHKGEFTFALAMPEEGEGETHTCSHLVISVDGAIAFLGALKEEVPFTPKKNEEVVLNSTPILLESVPEKTANGIEVVLEAGECPDGQVFDPKHEVFGGCVPKKY